MDDIWIINASPVIALAKVARLDLCTQLCRKIILTSAVAEEIEAGPID